MLQQARADAAMFYDGLNTLGRVLEELRDEELPWLKALSVLAPQSVLEHSSLIHTMLMPQPAPRDSPGTVPRGLTRTTLHSLAGANETIVR